VDEAFEQALAHQRFPAEVGVLVRVRDEVAEVTHAHARQMFACAHGSKKRQSEITRKSVGHDHTHDKTMAGVGSGWIASEQVGLRPGLLGSSAWFLSLV